MASSASHHGNISISSQVSGVALIIKASDIDVEVAVGASGFSGVLTHYWGGCV
jgi:hypothetical protein